MTILEAKRSVLRKTLAASAALVHPSPSPNHDHPLEAGCRRALVDAARVKEGKRAGGGKATVGARDRAVKKLSREEIDAVMAPWRKAAQELMDDYDARKKDLETLIVTLATVVPPEAGAEAHDIEWIYGGAYRSSGSQYARVAAELRQEELAEAFPHIEITLVSDGLGKREASGFRVVAKVREALDAVILKRRHPMTLRESVRRCWAKGANPRVFNPFLPHGYEEREGLDFFGGEVRK